MYKVGDIRNGYEVLPKDKRKTVILLSDDLRMTSGGRYSDVLFIIMLNKI